MKFDLCNPSDYLCRNIMPIRQLTLLSFFALSLTSFAQEQQVSLQFVSFPISASAKPVELIIGKEKTMNVELPTNALSPVYKVNRLSEWVIGKSSVGTEGQFVFDTYGKAPALASVKQLILVVRKGTNDSDGFDLIPMDNLEANFGGGMYFFMNAAKVDIAVEIGDKKFALKPLTHNLVKPSPSKTEGERQYLYTTLQFRKGEEAVPYYSSTWRFSEKARSLVFLYHDSNTNQLRTHTIRDYPAE
jgi:hypothetical protein